MLTDLPAGVVPSKSLPIRGGERKGTRFIGFFFCSLLLFGATGCGHHRVEVVRPEVLVRTLAFLTVGETSKQEVLSRLGEPSANFERGRILTYWLDEEHAVIGKQAGKARYSLVLVFEKEDRPILKAQSLVQTR